MGVVFFIIIFLIIVGVVSSSLSTNKPQSTKNAGNPKLNNAQQLVVNSAQRLVDIINESLEIANKSNNADTKVSRLNVAKAKIADLKVLIQKHSFIKIPLLPEIEAAIANMEQEFVLANYRETAEGNMYGESLEKEGQIDEAIAEYERLLKQGVDTPFTYRRLAILYSKQKKRDEELRVLRAAIKNIPIENSAHYKWFAERLAKKS